MAHFISSGKFWLKTIVISTITLLLMTIGTLSILNQLFHPEHIHQAAQQSLAGKGRAIRFDKKIQRRLFPRPTVILRQVVISQPNSDATAVYIDEMQLGLAWSSLFGMPQIEKWIFIRPEIRLTRQENGSWDLADLFSDNPNRPDINRLIVENGKVEFNLPKRLYQLNDFNLNIKNASEQPLVEAQGTFSSPILPDFHWQASGQFTQQQHIWHSSDLQLTGNSQLQHYPFQFQLNSQLNWQPHPHHLQLSKIKLTADSPQHQAHLQANANQATWHNGQFNLAELNASLTAQHQQTDWHNIIALNKLHYQAEAAHIDKFTLNSNRKQNGQNLAITLSSAAQWQAPKNIQLDQLRLTTRLEQLTGNPRPRLLSELSGQFHYQPNGQWQTELHGLLDNHAATIQANYTTAKNKKQPAKLAAHLQLAQINMAAYIAGLNHTEGFQYPTFLQTPNAPEIDAHIKIQTLQFPNLTINDLSTRLMANNARIVLHDLTAKLYGGSTEGGISMANTSPPTYHLQQYARDIQIRPIMQDLLRYGNIQGQGNATIDLSAQGSNHSQLTQSLNGNLQLDIKQGSWLGLDLNHALQGLPRGSLNHDSHQSNTPFKQFSVNSYFENGIGRHKNAELISDTLYLTSTGSTNLNTLILNENLLVRPANKQGTPIPINIRGPIHNPSVTVDYSSLTQGLNTPEEKQQAITHALKEQWQWLNPNKTP